MSGSDSPNQGNVYGTKGVAAPANVPSGRWGGQTWTDDSGNLWLFGGHEGDPDAEPEAEQRYRNDLWKYSISTNQCAWMSGDSVIHPTNIEKLLPLMLALRNSPFSSVQESLLQKLVELIAAFDYHLVEMIEKNIPEEERAMSSLVSKTKDNNRHLCTFTVQIWYVRYPLIFQ